MVKSKRRRKSFRLGGGVFVKKISERERRNRPQERIRRKGRNKKGKKEGCNEGGTSL